MYLTAEEYREHLETECLGFDCDVYRMWEEQQLELLTEGLEQVYL